MQAARGLTRVGLADVAALPDMVPSGKTTSSRQGLAVQMHQSCFAKSYSQLNMCVCDSSLSVIPDHCHLDLQLLHNYQVYLNTSAEALELP